MAGVGGAQSTAGTLGAGGLAGSGGAFVGSGGTTTGGSGGIGTGGSAGSVGTCAPDQLNCSGVCIVPTTTRLQRIPFFT